MVDLVLGQTNDKANPKVLFAWQSPNVGDTMETGIPPTTRQLKGGFFQPLSELEFRILDPGGVEVVPLTVVDTSDPLNILDDSSEGGRERIYILPFSLPVTGDPGAYTVEVTFVADPEDGPAVPAQTSTFSFRGLSDEHPVVNGYAQIVDALAQGFPLLDSVPPGSPCYSFADAQRAIERASRYIEMITSRFFEARYLVHDHDGGGGPIIQTDHSIIGLTQVAFTFTTFTPADLPIQEGDLRVYNRHIRQGMMEPDDRQDPRVEFLRTPVYRFPRSQILGEVDILSSYIGFTDSQQNVKMRGMWGYTDPDGSPFGKIPDLIVEATLRLAARYIQPLWSAIGGAGNAFAAAGPVTHEKTLDQQVKYSDAASKTSNNAFIGNFTGDAEVDQILALFMAPPRYRSA